MKYFVTGIDTNIGKSIATAYVAKLLMQQNKKVITQKLVQTGCEGISEDILCHRKIMGVGLFKEDKDFTTCKYVFKYPASPHLASAMENRQIDIAKIANNTEKLNSLYDIVLIEGAGGIMVPIKKDYLTLDFVKDYKLPVIFVVSARLGSLNHALLNLELFKYNNICLDTLVYNTYPKNSEEIENSTREYLKEYLSKNFPNAKFLEMGKVI